jgi:hypothetical protein
VEGEDNQGHNGGLTDAQQIEQCKNTQDTNGRPVHRKVNTRWTNIDRLREREREKEREREREERARLCKKKCVSEGVRERERERERVCVCVCVWKSKQDRYRAIVLWGVEGSESESSSRERGTYRDSSRVHQRQVGESSRQKKSHTQR